MGSAANVSIRSLLSHTSGIRDYWPQDYDTPEMLHPIEPQQIVARWARQPLDFATGTAWQYSNTGYTITGMIAEKAGGQPLFRFLQERIFVPLKMTSVVVSMRHRCTPRTPPGTCAMRSGRCGPRQKKVEAGSLPPGSLR